MLPKQSRVIDVIINSMTEVDPINRYSAPVALERMSLIGYKGINF